LRCGTVAVLNIFEFLWRWWRRSLAILSWWVDATKSSFIEDQSGRASLKTWVTTLAGPVTVARLAKRNIAVRILLAQRMFLASFDGFGPIASVFLFIVEQTTNTKLFNGRAVPASPITDTAGFVSENTVLPVTRSVADRRIGKLFVIARFADSPRVIAVLKESTTASSKNKTIGAIELLCTAIHALPVAIAVGHIGHDFTLGLASVRLLLLLSHPRRDGHGKDGTNDESLHGCSTIPIKFFCMRFNFSFQRDR